MEFMTTKEAARKGEVAERMVQYHCKAGRITGAVKMAGVCLILKEPIAKSI